jgi:hypothetical protein
VVRPPRDGTRCRTHQPEYSRIGSWEPQTLPATRRRLACAGRTSRAWPPWHREPWRHAGRPALATERPVTSAGDARRVDEPEGSAPRACTPRRASLLRDTAGAIPRA